MRLHLKWVITWRAAVLSQVAKDFLKLLSIIKKTQKTNKQKKVLFTQVSTWPTDADGGDNVFMTGEDVHDCRGDKS